MANGFKVLRKLDNGEELQVAWRPNRPLAERLVQDLMQSWPAQYEIEEAESPALRVPYRTSGRFGPN